MAMKKPNLYIPLFVAIVFLLTGCTSDEEKKALAYKNNDVVIESYAEFVTKPILEKEKTEEEVVEETVKKELGYSVLESYKKVGFSNPDSLHDTIKKIIADDFEIPKTPNLNSEEIAMVNKEEKITSDEYNKILSKKFKELTSKKLSDSEQKEEDEIKLRELYEKEYKEALSNVNKEKNPETIYEKQQEQE